MFGKRWLLWLGVFLLPVVSAYGGFSMSEFLSQEMVQFALLFVGFFAVFFFAMSRSIFRGKNKGMGAVLAMVLSLFVVGAAARQGLLGHYLGNFDQALLLFAAFVVVLVLVRLLYKRFSARGALVALLVGWILIWWIGAATDLPYLVLSPELLAAYEILFSLEIGLPIFIIVGLLYFLRRRRSDGS